MNSRVKDKIDEIEDYLAELLEIMPENFQSYIRESKTKAACERYFEKIIEAVVDLAFLIIKDKSLGIPEEDKKAFDSLADNKLIPEILAQKLKDAKGMRNIIAHEYGKVDDELVFESITEELEKDAREFIKKINEQIS